MSSQWDAHDKLHASAFDNFVYEKLLASRKLLAYVHDGRKKHEHFSDCVFGADQALRKCEALMKELESPLAIENRGGYPTWYHNTKVATDWFMVCKYHMDQALVEIPGASIDDAVLPRSGRELRARATWDSFNVRMINCFGTLSPQEAVAKFRDTSEEVAWQAAVDRANRVHLEQARANKARRLLHERALRDAAIKLASYRSSRLSLTEQSVNIPPRASSRGASTTVQGRTQQRSTAPFNGQERLPPQQDYPQRPAQAHLTTNRRPQEETRAHNHLPNHPAIQRSIPLSDAQRSLPSQQLLYPPQAHLAPPPQPQRYQPNVQTIRRKPAATTLRQPATGPQTFDDILGH